MEKGILQQLEFQRHLMIKSGLENGLQSEKTILLSRQLDLIINAYDAQKYRTKIIDQPDKKNSYSNSAENSL
ncbi:aspartyl-phosphate phosphatase Spo0E family protein [Solibacillus sp. FSL H8-0538]|uniref:aspartyl-phosphate phosphatase Spo0E family protein n=1 Tax=Solibacillus sp. FSL H8-0538 TaxID=2921400 RepID=UPI0030FB086A